MPVEFDYSVLRGRIITVFGRIEDFAEKMGSTPTTIGRKLNNKSEWSQSEMGKACELLEVPCSDIPNLFFCLKS
ncbi:MAG: DUF739 family protein [Acutalibacteraceae bacterium]